MLELYKDVDDDYLTWIVSDGEDHGRWSETIEAAVKSYKFSLTSDSDPGYGDNPFLQEGCTHIASGEGIDVLRLEAMLNE